MIRAKSNYLYLNTFFWVERGTCKQKKHSRHKSKINDRLILWLIKVREGARECVYPFVFFTAKYQILQLHPNDHSFFYSEMQNFETVPKRPFCFFHNETQNFKNFFETTIRFFTTKYRFLKVAPKRSLVFPTWKYKIWLFTINLVSFLKNRKKIKNMILRYLVCFFTMKNEIRNIVELWITFYSQKVLKIIDYRKLVNRLYNSFLKHWFDSNSNHNRPGWKPPHTKKSLF